MKSHHFIGLVAELKVYFASLQAAALSKNTLYWVTHADERVAKTKKLDFFWRARFKRQCRSTAAVLLRSRTTVEAKN